MKTAQCSSALSRRASSSFRYPLADSEQTAKDLSSKANKSLQGSQSTRAWCLSTCSNLSIRWRRKQATFVLICSLRSLIGWLQQLLSADENPYLRGNFAPCAETAPIQLEVEGSLPRELDGAYIRNGPNPVLPSSGKCNWWAPLHVPRPELMQNIHQIIKSAMFRWQAALRSSRNVPSSAAMAAAMNC